MTAGPVIEVAERAGTAADGEPRPREVVVSVLRNAVVLLDGATSPSLPPGGWYPGRLAGELAGRLAGYPGMDLADLLAAAIRAVARDHGPTPGGSPSSSVALVRWDDEAVEGLVLADGPVVAVTGTDVHTLSDGRGLGTETDSDAAYEACRARWPRTAVPRVLLASGRVSRGVGAVFPDWTAVTDLVARSGADAVLDAVGDGDRALAVVTFAPVTLDAAG